MKSTKIMAALIGAAIMVGSVTPAAVAKDAGDILVRLRGIAVVPDAGGTATGIGGDADIDNAYVPELDFSYFFTENIAAELILATTKHDVTMKGSSLGDAALGDVWLLPPTLTLQYHFTPKSDFSPYIGAGVNYTMFYNDGGSRNGAVNSVKYEDAFGLALQAGIDYKLDERWSLNFDVKKIFLETDVKVNGGAIRANNVNIDPWIFGVGVGYRF
jgi:outer membrane protein